MKEIINGIKKIKGDIISQIHTYPIRVGFLPDIHAGASRSICPEKFITKEGTIIQPNEIQKMLRILWGRNIAMFKKYSVQYIFVIGDTIAGSNPAEAGAYISITDLNDQAEMACQLLKEVWVGCDKKPVFLVWSGTPYHEFRKGYVNYGERIVEKLQASGIKSEFMQDVSYIELFGGIDLHTGNKRMRRLFVAHEAPTGLVYPATLMSRDISWALESEASSSTLPVDAIIRAHIHHSLHVDHSGKHAVQLPCWLAHTPYKQTIKYFFKLQPTLGGAMMLMDEYGRLQFWGGSYPFGFTKEENLKVHRLTVTTIGLNPSLPDKYTRFTGVEYKCLS